VKNETTQTYDRIATAFADNSWDLYLKKALDGFAALLPERACILDIGCGPGRDSRHFRERGFEAVGADLSWGMLREARRRIGSPLIRCDMRVLPFRAMSFDGGWICASLLHLSHSEAPQALKEVRRVVRRKAPVFVGLISGEGERWHTPNSPRFFAYYHPDEITTLLQECGFSIHSSWTQPGKDIVWIDIIARKM
jgi:ubiquinone/menaquinone biosynthesis C-methylase UbiE